MHKLIMLEKAKTVSRPHLGLGTAISPAPTPVVNVEKSIIHHVLPVPIPPVVNVEKSIINHVLPMSIPPVVKLEKTKPVSKTGKTSQKAKKYKASLVMPRAPKYGDRNKFQGAKFPEWPSSFQVFNQFVVYNTEENSCDATRILSKACYDKWKQSRKHPPKNPREAYRRALTAHLRGVDGRRPFSREVEDSLLTVVRRKLLWPCFRGTRDRCVIGIQGFPSLGYHEKTREDTRRLLLSFVKYDAYGACEACDMLSTDCYKKWKQANFYTVTNNHEEAFRDIITSTARGLNGYKPFEKPVEKSLLLALRSKKRWECFKDHKYCNIGVEGFPFLGYHEMIAASTNFKYNYQDLLKAAAIKAQIAAGAAGSQTLMYNLDPAMHVSTTGSNKRPRVE